MVNRIKPLRRQSLKVKRFITSKFHSVDQSQLLKHIFLFSSKETFDSVNLKDVDLGLLCFNSAKFQ